MYQDQSIWQTALTKKSCCQAWFTITLYRERKPHHGKSPTESWLNNNFE